MKLSIRRWIPSDFELEQNIQVALQSGGIDLEDAIDIRQIRNLKLANQLLKQKRKRKLQREEQLQQQNIKAQADANAQAQQQAAEAEAQKQQVITQSNLELEQGKSQFEIERMRTEAQIKRELMAEEFNYQVQLEQLKMQAESQKERDIEDRKDKRVKLQGTQQSQMIDQRKNNLLPINFETENTTSPLGM